jgi:hypothetical protein
MEIRISASYLRLFALTNIFFASFSLRPVKYLLRILFRYGRETPFGDTWVAPPGYLYGTHLDDIQVEEHPPGS